MYQRAQNVNSCENCPIVVKILDWATVVQIRENFGKDDTGDKYEFLLTI